MNTSIVWLLLGIQLFVVVSLLWRMRVKGNPGMTGFDIVVMVLDLFALIAAVPFFTVMAMGRTPTFWYLLPPMK